MMCDGSARSRQWASDWPVRLVLISATTTPIFVKPNHAATYSGRFGMSKATRSPGLMRFDAAQRALQRRGLQNQYALSLGVRARHVLRPKDSTPRDAGA